MEDAGELAEAVRLVVARHLDALATREPERMARAVDGLLKAFGRDLPAALSPARSEDRLDLVGRARDADGEARCQLAVQVLRKRLAEAEGALMHLQLALDRDGRMRERRIQQVESTARAVVDTSIRHAWAAGSRIDADAVPAAAFLQAAREALLCGAPDAAAALAQRALGAGVVAPAASHAARLQKLNRLLSDHGDVTQVWALLDEVESLVNASGMGAF